jgi:hypothetical protein
MINLPFGLLIDHERNGRVGLPDGQDEVMSQATGTLLISGLDGAIIVKTKRTMPHQRHQL